MTLDRRAALALLGALTLAPTAALTAPSLIEDALGRPVRLGSPARRIVLLNARDVLSMAILHPDPTSLIVGWADVERLDCDLLRDQYGQDRMGTPIPVVGGQTADSLSIERILSLNPDLVVATVFMDPDRGRGPFARRLEEAGIPAVFSDAASNTPADRDDGLGEDPFVTLARMHRLWGALLGREKQAEAFLAFVAAHLERIDAALVGVAPTKTYLEIQSTREDCCWAAGERLWGRLLARAGGQGLSAVTAPWYAQVSREQLMAEAPAVYIATGGAFAVGGRPAIAPGLDPASARADLRGLTERVGFAALPAVQNGRVHGVWTGLLTAPPLGLLFVETAARWLHPDRFPDLDPARTLEALNRRFLARPLPGPCWVDLPSA